MTHHNKSRTYLLPRTAFISFQSPACTSFDLLYTVAKICPSPTQPFRARALRAECAPCVSWPAAVCSAPSAGLGCQRPRDRSSGRCRQNAVAYAHHDQMWLEIQVHNHLIKGILNSHPNVSCDSQVVTCWCSAGNVGMNLGIPQKGWFKRVIPLVPAEHLQVKVLDLRVDSLCLFAKRLCRTWASGSMRCRRLTSGQGGHPYRIPQDTPTMGATSQLLRGQTESALTDCDVSQSQHTQLNCSLMRSCYCVCDLKITSVNPKRLAKPSNLLTLRIHCYQRKAVQT